jgi:hypothetical protein
VARNLARVRGIILGFSLIGGARVRYGHHQVEPDPVEMARRYGAEISNGTGPLDVIVANVVDRFGLRISELRDLGQDIEPDRGMRRVPTEPQDGMA